MAGPISRKRWSQIVAVSLFFGVLAAWLSFAPVARVAEASSQSSSVPIKLYVLDGGTLTIAQPESFGVTKEEVLAEGKDASPDMPVPSFLVVHRQGTLLFDTGLGDQLIGRPESETKRGTMGQIVRKSLKSQLTAIGYPPEKITYLVLSHLHFDHVGNANDYAGSTWIVEKAERDSVWGEQPLQSFANPSSTTAFSALKTSKTKVIEGDFDVFGDGSVVVKSTPGHTPGHVCLYVRLAKTGPVVLTGDLYHYQAERTLKKMPAREVASGQTAASRAALDAFAKQTGSQLWIGHEMMQWNKLKKAPNYYE